MSLARAFRRRALARTALPIESCPRCVNRARANGAGDAVAILPGQRHKLWNTGSEVLRLLCCCAPAYEHEDTVITEGK